MNDMSEWTLTRLSRGLRERTDAVDRVVHAALSSPSRASYRRWLCDLYRFVVTVEAKLVYTHDLDLGFIQTRIKSGRLSTDLLALGLTSSEYQRLARPVTVPAFEHLLEGLGWLFVIERITLQLADVRTRLTPLLDRELAIAGSFFEVYDGLAAEKWLDLGRVIDRALIEDSDARILTAAAAAALDCLESTVAEAPPETIVIDTLRSA